MNGVCVTCGQSGRVEAHHVAGRANHPTATVNVCPECHRLFLTVWQYAAGVPLDHQAPRSDGDRFRAWVEGLFGLLVLHAQRAQSPPGVAEAAVLSQRGFSRLLNHAEPSVAGTAPNGTIELYPAAPAIDGDPLASVVGLADLFSPVVFEVYDESHPLTRVVSLVRGDPASVLHGIRGLLADPRQADDAARLLADAVRWASESARALLAAPDPTTALPGDRAPVADAVRAWLGAHDQVAALLAACLPTSGERAA